MRHAIALLALLCLAAPAAAAECDAYDVNADLSVDQLDYAQVLEAATEGQSCPACDLTGNGAVNVVDVIAWLVRPADCDGPLCSPTTWVWPDAWPTAALQCIAWPCLLDLEAGAVTWCSSTCTPSATDWITVGQSWTWDQGESVQLIALTPGPSGAATGTTIQACLTTGGD